MFVAACHKTQHKMFIALAKTAINSVLKSKENVGRWVRVNQRLPWPYSLQVCLHLSEVNL